MQFRDITGGTKAKTLMRMTQRSSKNERKGNAKEERNDLRKTLVSLTKSFFLLGKIELAMPIKRNKTKDLIGRCLMEWTTVSVW